VVSKGRRRPEPPGAQQGEEEIGGRALEPAAVAAAVGAANGVGMWAASGFDDAVTGAAGGEAIAGAVEPQAQADDAGCGAAQALKSRSGGCTFGWRSGAGGQRFQFVDAFGKRALTGGICARTLPGHINLSGPTHSPRVRRAFSFQVAP
jgi:hypothetical protein